MEERSREGADDGEIAQAPGDGNIRTLLVTVDEAADQLRVHKSTVWDLIRRGDLKVVRLGRKATRVTTESLLGYVDRHATVA